MSPPSTPTIVVVDLSDLISIFNPDYDLYYGYRELTPLRALVRRIGLKDLIGIALCQPAYDYRDSVFWEQLESHFPEIDQELIYVERSTDLMEALNHLVQYIVLAADQLLERAFSVSLFRYDTGYFRFVEWHHHTAVFSSNQEA